MLDSIREIFDILGLSFESVTFGFDSYHDKDAKCLDDAIYKEDKCPVVVVRDNFFDPNASEFTSHAMVAAGVEDGYDEDEGQVWIQLKNSYRDDPGQEGMSLLLVKAEKFQL